MKKLLTLGVIAGALAAMAPVANAATATSTFVVSATLTSACKIGAFPVGGVAFGAVTAFVAPANATTTATVSCTRSFAAPTMDFDSAPTGGGTGVGNGGFAAAPTGAGVLPNGLYYTLSAALGAATPGVAPTAAGGLNAQDADDRTVTVTGAMPAQAGSNAGAVTHTRTLTISF